MIEKVSLFDSDCTLSHQQKHLIEVYRYRDSLYSRCEKFWRVYSQIQDEIRQLSDELREIKERLSDEEKSQVLMILNGYGGEETK